ncbi:MAG: class I SAM-dependent methyltransferase [Ornithinimicrobium sp.]
MDAAMVSRLAGPEGAEVFAHLPADYDPDAALRANTRLRSLGYPVEVIAAALSQWELRHRARPKFGPEAAQMFFTRDGLEQSTRDPVADLHARRLASAGVRHVWDLGCGIGGDALAFRRHGMTVTAIESDPLTAAVARANLTSTRRSSEGAATVRTVRVEEVLADWEDAAAALSGRRPGDHAVWLDPARRTSGVSDAAGRTHRIRSARDMTPPWDVVLRAVRSVPTAGVKVGASFNAERLETGTQAQWVSVDNQAVECVVWWGLAATGSGSRVASVRNRGIWHHLASDDSAMGATPEYPGDAGAAQVVAGAYVCEADPAVAAAGLRSQVCRQSGATELGAANYLLSPQPIDLPWARCWQINEVLPLSVKALRAWARKNDIGPLTLKKPPGRSTSPLARLDPENLRAKIGARGSGSATLLLTEINDHDATAALWICPVDERSGD